MRKLSNFCPHDIFYNPTNLINLQIEKWLKIKPPSLKLRTAKGKSLRLVTKIAKVSWKVRKKARGCGHNWIYDFGSQIGQRLIGNATLSRLHISYKS